MRVGNQTELGKIPYSLVTALINRQAYPSLANLRDAFWDVQTVVTVAIEEAAHARR